MSKEIMHRAADDNEYLHPDFHGALSVGIDYLEQKFGADAVREYLHGFVRSYYRPLIDRLRSRGLVALEEHYRQVYSREGGRVRFHRLEDELLVEVEACPAVMHLRRQGYPVARLFLETVSAVGAALCDGSEFAFELTSYDEQTGRSRQRFYRRTA